MRQAPREGAVDALRALALLPVVAVNWLGYAYLFGAGPLGPAQPATSVLAQLLWWVVAAVLACKGITLLAFLFGYSQGLSRRARGAQALAARRRRMGRLLLLGLLHGALIYAGDILTLYALCGLVMLRWSRLPTRRLLRRAKVLLVCQGVLLVLLSWPMWWLDATVSPSVVGPQDVAGVGAWLAANGMAYLTAVLTMATVGVLQPLGLMTAGLAAARLRLFSHRRWQALLQHWSRRWLWPGLLINALWATGLWWGYHGGVPGQADLLYGFGMFVAMPLLMAWVPRVVLASRHPAAGTPGLLQALMQALMQAGRHTLTFYVGSSALSLVLFSGLGWRWQPGTAVLFALVCLTWAAWVLCAQRWRGPWPLEAWLSR